jgi:hypothetical protein
VKLPEKEEFICFHAMHYIISRGNKELVAAGLENQYAV